MDSATIVSGWAQPIHFLGTNTVMLMGAAITTRTALTTIASWSEPFCTVLPRKMSDPIGVPQGAVAPAKFGRHALLRSGSRHSTEPD